MSLPYHKSIRELMSRSPPMPEKELIVGWRGWLHRGDPRCSILPSDSLFSLTRTTEWMLREVFSCGEFWDGSSPSGIYSCKTRDGFLTQCDLAFSLVGEVYLWGLVIEHEHGYRAEYAYPKSLQVRPGFDPVRVMQLEEDYGVPVTFAEDLGRQREAQRVSPFMQQGVNLFAQANANQLRALLFMLMAR